MEIGARQAVAFRLAAQGLHARDGAPLDVLAGWAVQDSPPGAASSALAARCADLTPGWLDGALADRSAVALYNPRTATAVVPAADVATFAAGLRPAAEDELNVNVRNAVPERDEDLAEPIALAVDAVADVLDGRVLSRDDLHEELRRRLPDELLPWCPGCKSHHARRGLLVMAGLHGRLCLAGRAGRRPAFARTDQWVGWDEPDPAVAGAEVVRRYLRWYGPSTRQAFAQWAGLATPHGRRLWELVAGELEEVRVDGERAWILRDDAARLDRPPAASGVRLLPSGDPLLLGREREQLVPEPAARKRLWSGVPGMGLVLADGAAVALWRARKQGARLEVTVEPFGDVPRAELEAEAERVAAHRGCRTATVELPARLGR